MFKKKRICDLLVVKPGYKNLIAIIELLHDLKSLEHDINFIQYLKLCFRMCQMSLHTEFQPPNLFKA